MKSLLQSSEQLLSTLHEQLDRLKEEQPDPLLQARAAIPVCLEHVRLLRKQIRSFRNIPRYDEIRFFKYLKPQFVSQYLYYVMQYRLHYEWPMGDTKTQQLYLENEIAKLRRFFQENHQFCSYYGSHSAYLDNTYFVRGQEDVDPSEDHLLCGTDPSFFTPKDLLVSKMLANNLFCSYLTGQLDQVQQLPKETSPKTKTPGLVWTESKSALMEVIYGIYLSGAVNGGNCEIKTLATVFCTVFNVEIKHIYDYIYHLKMRKLEPTKYTDCMRTCLLQNYSNEPGAI